MSVPRWKQLKENAHLRENLVKRAKIIASIRAFFDSRGYLEVDTPLVVAKPGMEPYLDPFETSVTDPFGNRYDAYLITSPEYAMKKLLAAGFPKIYQLGKCFRNGEAFEGRHNPEFTMLEWYQAGTDYLGIMDETEALVKAAANSLEEASGRTILPTPNTRSKLSGRAISTDSNTRSKLSGRINPTTSAIFRNGREIDLAGAWARLTVKEAFWQYAQVDLDAAMDGKKILIEAAAKLGHHLPEDASWDDAFFSVFLNAVEPHLGAERPTFLYDYPVSMAALSKVSARDPRYAERFELYIGGLELANAFTELTDAQEQRRRLEEEHALRQRLGRTDYGLDEDFLSALEEMPAAGGIALGVDRLIMILLGEEDIRQVMAFPAESIFETKKLT